MPSYKQHRSRFSFRIALIVSGLFVTSALAQPGTSRIDAKFFQNKVLPILENNCYSCHSHEDDEMRAALVVDSRQGLLQGGISGPSIVPGDPSKSLLIQLIRGEDEDRPMPPKKLMSQEDIKVLEDWVKRGAPDPRAMESGDEAVNPIWDKAEDHWAFQQVKMPHSPRVKDKDWGKSTLDLFVLGKLEQNRLKPAPEADARTLIRRAYFDLIGLPPTMEQVQAFEVDYAKNADAAMKMLINELLESLHYGERWGRHWLDLARYADVSGAQPNRNGDTRLPFAYTYRDYVIRAFNDDKPYDEFVKEQLAADQMKLRDQRDVAALGFMSVGTYAGTSEDVVAERIDAVTKVFLGLTVACARCHDHKFDPIPTTDFYALHGVFKSTRELGTGVRAEFVDPDLCPIIEQTASKAEREAHDAEIAEIEAKLQIFDDEHWLPKEELWATQRAEYLRLVPMTKQDMGGLDARTYMKKHTPELDFAVYSAWRRQAVKSFKNHDPVWSPWRGFMYVKPGQYEKRAEGIGLQIQKLAKTKGINPLIMAAVTKTKPRSMDDIVRAYIETFEFVDRKWKTMKKRRPGLVKMPDVAEEQIRQIMYGEYAPGMRDPRQFNQVFGNQLAGKRNRIVKELFTKKYHDERAPARAMIVQDIERPRDSYVFIRGESNQKGEVVPRRNLTILGGTDGEPFTVGSGRLELAQAIASPKSPLTARVMVNRIWQHHFGQPLVDSPSDFGLQVEEPEHVALLDWLSMMFVKRGWSVKQMHRLIMTSATWRQSSVEHPDYAHQNQIDPDNLLLWRQNMKRLEFEPIRDSLLYVCGTLDTTVYGRSERIFDNTRATRRSVYAYIDRYTQPDLMATFDMADPQATSELRFVTTVAPQALYLMNGGMLRHNISKFMGGEDWKTPRKDSDRIDWLYAKAFQRLATDLEKKVLLDFLVEARKDYRAAVEANSKLKKRKRKPIVNPWAQAIQIVLMSNEMVYVP